MLVRLLSRCGPLVALVVALGGGHTPATAQVPAVMYHAYESSTYYNRDNFRDHLDYFVANSFRTITLDQFYEWRVNDGILPYRPILLTVDDNYSLGYTEMYPALAARGMVATNYTHTRGIGIGIPKATWPQVAEMDAAGVFLVESHSQTHPNLTTISGTQLRQEVVGSRADITANVGGKVSNHFAYPGGNYNAAVIAELQAAGYKTGMTVKTGLNTRTTPLFELQRFGGDGRTLTQFLQSSGLGTLPPPPPGAGWILDDADPAALPKGTSWTTTSGSVAYQGKHLVASGTAATVRWAATLPEAGTMRIHARWAAAGDRSAAATYTIQAADGAHAVTVDQRTQGGQWVALGSYSFAPGQPAIVTLGGTGGSLSADAVWFEPIATPAAPLPLTIDVPAGLMTQRQAGRGWIGPEWSSLEKTGTGTLVLDRGNALVGPVRIAAGALALTDPVALAAASRIDVLAGATLDLTGLSGGYQPPPGQAIGGAGTIAGSVVFGRGVTLSPGGTAASGPVARVAIVSVPEPSGAALAVLALAAASALTIARRRRRRDPRSSRVSAERAA
ncbi:MAG: polysaccharide deacetylase family protein [Planctomycetaceae bacterium]